MIRDLIQNDLINARKFGDKDKVTYLSTVLGEIQKIENGKEKLSDEKVVSLLKKFISGVEEIQSLSIGKITDDVSVRLAHEKCVYKSYIPQAPEESVYKEIVREFVINAEDKNIGAIMKNIKPYLQSKNIPFDGKLISIIIKEIL